MRLDVNVYNAPRVGFQIGGAQKCGTNALFSALYGQPGLALAIRKEIRFFLNHSYFSSNREVEEIVRDYGQHFPTNSRHRVAGEATPEYMWNRAAAERIRCYNPNTKWIVCLRNPVARAYSQWKMMIRNGFETRDFLTCVKSSLEGLQQSTSFDAPLSADPRGLLTRGLYDHQIERLNSMFSDDQVYVVFTSNLRLFTKTTASMVAEFIKSGSKFSIGSVAHTSYRPRSIPCNDSLALLRLFYADEIDLLETKLKCDLSVWRDQPLSD